VERDLQYALLAWKNRAGRLPLIIQGARQVGKTYLMKWLGERHFQRFAYFNFDERPELCAFFQSNKDVDRITAVLSLASGIELGPDSLIIFDEIQECPEALNALKYFAEKKPGWPIVCAGSLLGVMLHQGHSFPVGKVEFMTLHPMTFREVLPNWNPTLAAYLAQREPLESIPDYFFNDILDQFKKYLVTGGLPAVVAAMTVSATFEAADSLLDNLVRSYRGDFSKHPVMSDIAKISHVFDALPAQLSRENRKFVYQLVRPGARAREYEDAIQWLINAGLLHRVHQVSKPSLPLTAYEDISAFKLYAFDVGVLRKLSRLGPQAYGEGRRLLTEFKGAITENYILQSLVAQMQDTPCYWSSGNTAKVDFIIQHQNHLIPVEVKSDENVRSRSLTIYQQKYNPLLRIRYSLKNLSFQDGLLNIPHFLADNTRGLMDQLL
jgi:predicted AAA+ superfamily ATPase